MTKALMVWKSKGVQIRQHGASFFVGRGIPQCPSDWKPPYLVFGPLPSLATAVDWTRDHFFGVRAARRRNLLRAQVIVKKCALHQFDLDHLEGNYFCVLTTVAKILNTPTPKKGN